MPNTNNLNISPEMISKLTSMLNNNNSNSNNTLNQDPDNAKNPSDSVFSNLDLDTILKFKNIISSLNQTDDNNSKLLNSLKPYLNESRQKKIDQYVKFLKFSKLGSLLKNETGDKN